MFRSLHRSFLEVAKLCVEAIGSRREQTHARGRASSTGTTCTSTKCPIDLPESTDQHYVLCLVSGVSHGCRSGALSFWSSTSGSRANTIILIILESKFNNRTKHEQKRPFGTIIFYRFLTFFNGFFTLYLFMLIFTLSTRFSSYFVKMFNIFSIVNVVLLDVSLF